MRTAAGGSGPRSSRTRTTSTPSEPPARRSGSRPKDGSTRMARRLGREEGILGGPSSGCNVVAALKVFRRRPDLRRIVTVVPDTAQRYFSEPLFGDPVDADTPARDHRIDEHTRAELDRHADR